MKSEVSCLNTRAIFDYLLRKSIDPRPYLDDLCADLDQIEDPFEYLSDRNNWVSSAVVTRLLARLSRELDDPQVPFHIGYDSIVHRRFGYIQDIFLRLFTSPLQGLRKAQEVNDRFNRTKKVELSDLAPGRAVVRLHWFEGMEQSRDICLYNQGIYSAIPRVWGLKPASLIETQCAFDGGEICEYRLRWQPVPRLLGAVRKFFVPRALFEKTVREIEADKDLLGKKYREVQELSVRLRQKIRELETIHESGKAIVSILDRKDLLNVIMRLATTSLGYDRAMIMLVNEEEKSLVMAASSGGSPEQMKQFGGYRVPLSRAGNVLVRTFESGTPVLVDELSRRSLNQKNPILQAFSPTSFAIVPLINRGKVIGVMAADRASSKMTIAQEDLDYLVGFGNHVAVALENSRLYESLEQTYLGAIQSLARAVEAKDPYTNGHSERVGHFSEWLADSIELPESQTRTLVLACRIHDIGKIGVSEKILHKPGKLERDEKTVIRQHPVTGETIIRPLKGLEEVARIIRHHHERYDGTGYPDRLKGDAIPVESRMIAIADCYDAMTTRRPYRKPLPAEIVLRELKDNRGSQFDPRLTDSFLSLLEAGTFPHQSLEQPWPWKSERIPAAPSELCSLQAVPPSVSRLYMQLMGRVYFARHPRERERYVTPLQEIFGSRAAAADFDGLAARVLRGIFDHYFEKLLNAYWGIERMRGMLLRDVELIHEDLLARSLREGGGVILNTAHFGALEFLPATLAFRGYPVAMMARFKTPRLRETIRRLAGEAGLELLDADDRRVLPKAIASLRRGSILIYQVDEISCWRPCHGKVMSLFGRRICLDRTVELLQRRTGAALLLGLMERVGGGRYQLSFETPSEHLPAPTRLGPDAQLIKRVEHYIYSFPEQWYNWKDVTLLDPLAV